MARTTKSRTDWAAIAGNWSFKGRVAKYSGATDAADGIVLSPGALRNGRVSTKVFLSDTERCVGRILLGYDAETERYFSVGLGGESSAYTVEEFVPSQGRRQQIAQKGNASQLDNETWYEVEAELRARSLALTVNGILVINQTLPYCPRGAQTGLFARGDGEVQFAGFKVGLRVHRGGG